MHETESSFLSDDPDQGLTVLEEFLTRFLEAWEADPPPDLRAFLPPAGAIRRITLAELIKVDLEYRWRVHQLPKRLDEYCREFPELLAGGIPPDLVYEEFHILKQAGEPVDAQEYLTAFPEQDTEIACLLGLDQEYASTALFKDVGKAELSNIEPGQRLDDFELLARLGAGAFAHVYLARQVSMQRLVAVKISADHGTEPQTLAQLDHNHIVRVYDQRSLSDRGLRLLYMQYVAGGTLQGVVRELRDCADDGPCGALLLRAVDGALDDRGEARPGESRLRKRIQNARWDETVCWIGSRLASALEYAHGLGVLHRDIKPANVLLTAEGMPQLADFNISFSSKLDGATPAAYFGGSLAYMSPEQLEAYSPAYDRQPDSLDARSDLYSLGVLLWELLTGRRPFHDRKGEGGPVQMIDEMIERRRNGPPEDKPPPWCAARILDVLRKCLAPDPDDRFQSGGELAAQLELCRHPKAHDLLIPPKNSWRRRLLPWSGLVVMLILLVPNVAAGIFNFKYNDDAMRRVLPQLSYNVFNQCVLVINSVLYPIGLVWAFVRPHRIWLRAREGQESGVRGQESETGGQESGLPAHHSPLTTHHSTTHHSPPGIDDDLRARALGLGHFAAVMAVLLWALGGLAYPIAIDAASGDVPPIVYAQFFSSLVLCGLVAAAYPFFFISLFALRCMYPGLLRDSPGVQRDVPLLMQLRNRAKLYLLIGALAPMLGVVAVVALTFLLRSGRAELSDMQLAALVTFAGAGALGFGLLWRVNNLLQADVEAIVDATANVRQ